LKNKKGWYQSDPKVIDIVKYCFELRLSEKETVEKLSTLGYPKITSHEWETARRMKDDYWLYIVENAMDDPKITTFKNPFEIFKDTVRKEQVIEYRYIIDDWKQKTNSA